MHFWISSTNPIARTSSPPPSSSSRHPNRSPHLLFMGFHGSYTVSSAAIPNGSAQNDYYRTGGDNRGDDRQNYTPVSPYLVMPEAHYDPAGGSYGQVDQAAFPLTQHLTSPTDLQEKQPWDSGATAGRATEASGTPYSKPRSCPLPPIVRLDRRTAAPTIGSPGPSTLSSAHGGYTHYAPTVSPVPPPANAIIQPYQYQNTSYPPPRFYSSPSPFPTPAPSPHYYRPTAPPPPTYQHQPPFAPSPNLPPYPMAPQTTYNSNYPPPQGGIPPNAPRQSTFMAILRSFNCCRP